MATRILMRHGREEDWAYYDPILGDGEEGWTVYTDSSLNKMKMGDGETHWSSLPYIKGYIHPTGDGNLHVPANGTNLLGAVLTAGATAGALSWTYISSAVLRGYEIGTNALVTAADSIATGIGKLQKQIVDHLANISNPHSVTAAQVGAIPASEKGAAGGITPLGADSKVAAIYLPSYVDDVVESETFAALPVTGEASKIYVITTGADIDKQYRWSGSAYRPIISSPGSTDAVPEGSANFYYTTARVAASITASTSKTTPVDADSIAIINSEASNVLARLTLGNLKAFFLTYFNTQYNNYVHPTSDGNLHVPATSTTNDGKVLTAGPTAGSLSWATPASSGEPALGNPSTDGYVLSSTAAGTRSWVAPSSGSGGGGYTGIPLQMTTPNDNQDSPKSQFKASKTCTVCDVIVTPGTIASTNIWVMKRTAAGVYSKIGDFSITTSGAGTITSTSFASGDWWYFKVNGAANNIQDITVVLS